MALEKLPDETKDLVNQGHWELWKVKNHKVSYILVMPPKPWCCRSIFEELNKGGIYELKENGEVIQRLDYYRELYDDYDVIPNLVRFPEVVNKFSIPLPFKIKW